MSEKSTGLESHRRTARAVTDGGREREAFPTALETEIRPGDTLTLRYVSKRNGNTISATVRTDNLAYIDDIPVRATHVLTGDDTENSGRALALIITDGKFPLLYRYSTDHLKAEICQRYQPNDGKGAVEVPEGEKFIRVREKIANVSLLGGVVGIDRESRPDTPGTLAPSKNAI